MERMSKLLSAVFFFVDTVGTYSMSAEQRRRADKKRQEVAKKAFVDKEHERQEALAEKKAEQRRAEQVRRKP
jgi:Protein of unknown function (DUF1682)